MDYLIIIKIIQLIILLILGLATLYIFFFAVAGLFYRQPQYVNNKLYRKIAVLIPGFREDEVITGVAREALKQDYPQEFFDVVIIADSFRPDTINRLKALPISVIEVSFEKSTKAKALNMAMEKLSGSYDLAVILDADNVMARDFLTKINRAFEKNYYAVQGHRTAKNMNTSLAILDSVSEEINNHIFRKGHRRIGLSSAIIGSGMAFRYDYFKKIMSTVTAVGGFDKEIELKMLKEGYKIDYLDDAYVYDEKVQKAEVFSNQRRRWLSAQLHYFRKDFMGSVKDLFTKGNIDYFDKAIQFIQPPRILLLGAVLIFGAIFIVTDLFIDKNSFFPLLWLLLIAVCITSFVVSIPASLYNLKTAGAMASLPKGMILMVGSLLKIRGANKTFIHTSHTSKTPDV
jgi:cellulose synthase/poly-beta-1,6-N-acetylglucosamine synthase-like glycosyltransferase